MIMQFLQAVLTDWASHADSYFTTLGVELKLKVYCQIREILDYCMWRQHSACHIQRDQYLQLHTLIQIQPHAVTNL